MIAPCMLPAAGIDRYAGTLAHVPVGPPSPNELYQVLRGVVDPELGGDIVDLGMVRHIEVERGGRVTVTIALTTAGCPLRAQIQRDVRARAASIEGVTEVSLEWDEMSADEKRTAMDRARRIAAERTEETSVGLGTQVVLIASGKGGVGKSSVSVNLAAALAKKGLAVGLLDADIWGFSVPRMLGVSGRLEGIEREGRKLMLPNEREVGDGLVRVVSMGFLVEDETSALMWRGLMLNRGVQHFLQDVEWGDDLDYLLIDMPPGTGDVQMGVARMIPRAEVVVVTTPAIAAQKVAIRVVGMARKNYLRIAGVIENMSTFECEHGDEYALFGEGGGAALAHEAGVPLLGQVPIETAVSAGGDRGEPAVLGGGRAAQAFAQIADALYDEVVPPRLMATCSARIVQAADQPSGSESVFVDVPTRRAASG